MDIIESVQTRLIRRCRADVRNEPGAGYQHKHSWALFTFGAFSAVLLGCHTESPGTFDSTPHVAAVSAEPSMRAQPSTPSLKVTTKNVKPGIVEFTVRTDLLTPLSATASLDLQDQKDDDSAIGTSRHFTLTGPTTRMELEAINDANSMDGKALPTGKYDATVTVYAQSDSNASRSLPNASFIAKQVILLRSDRSRVSVEREGRLQGWVLENVPSNAPWNEQQYRSKLGPFDESPSTLSPLHEAYYFPNVNMTLIVNRLRNEVSVWRVGRATR